MGLWVSGKVRVMHDICIVKPMSSTKTTIRRKKLDSLTETSCEICNVVFPVLLFLMILINLLHTWPDTFCPFVTSATVSEITTKHPVDDTLLDFKL